MSVVLINNAHAAQQDVPQGHKLKRSNAIIAQPAQAVQKQVASYGQQNKEKPAERLVPINNKVVATAEEALRLHKEFYGVRSDNRWGSLLKDKDVIAKTIGKHLNESILPFYS